MNRMTAVYADEVQEALKFKPATLAYFRGKVNSCLNHAFSDIDLSVWMRELKIKHPEHPVIVELKRLASLMKRNKIDLVLW